MRFLAVAFGSIDSSYSKLSNSLDMSSKTLGSSNFNTLLKIHIPLIRTGILAAIIIVFVDCMKELPATFISGRFAKPKKSQYKKTESSK